MTTIIKAEGNYPCSVGATPACDEDGDDDDEDNDVTEDGINHEPGWCTLPAGSRHLTPGENLSDPVRGRRNHHHRYGHLSIMTP